MTKDQLITKQQLELEQLKSYKREVKGTLKHIHLSFYSIGAPLNDNKLKFNNDQLKWLMEISDWIQTLK